MKNKNDDNVRNYLFNERLEGMDQIRLAIDPQMSRATFYRRHRPYLGHILMQYKRWWTRHPPIRYFTFRRLLIAYLLERKLV